MGLFNNFISKEESKPLPNMAMLAGLALPEISYLEAAYIGLFLLICFSLAIVLRKRKRDRKRGEIRKFLFSVGGYVSNYENRMGKDSETYDKLILTEFPNVMKLSKNNSRKG